MLSISSVVSFCVALVGCRDNFVRWDLMSVSGMWVVSIGGDV